MQKVKLFWGIVSELEALEHDINEWLGTAEVRVISLSGNVAPQTHTGQTGLETFPSSDVLVIVMYEDHHG